MFPLDPNYEQETTILMMEGKTELIDHLFKYWEKLTEYFFTVEDVKLHTYNIDPVSRVMASVIVRLD